MQVFCKVDYLAALAQTALAPLTTRSEPSGPRNQKFKNPMLLRTSKAPRLLQTWIVSLWAGHYEKAFWLGLDCFL